MSRATHCPVCGDPFAEVVRDAEPTVIECATCGRFRVALTVLATSLSPDHNELTAMQRAAISHRLREATDQGREPLLTTFEMESLIANARLPSPNQQAINLLRFVGENVSQTGRPLKELPQDIHAIVGSPNREFALRIVKQLVQLEVLEAIPCGHLDARNEVMEIDLTLRGWEQYDAERRGAISGGYGFIALKFGDPILDPFLRDVIKPAVSGVGYELIDMRDAAQAGIIDNVMRARIRDAAFVLVDLTHANEGAYWEAGYAEGLGKPVLYLCSREVFEKEGTHFDTNHCTTIQWDAAQPEPFATELIATLRRSLGLFAS